MEGGDKVTDDHMLLPQVEDKRVHAFVSLRKVNCPVTTFLERVHSPRSVVGATLSPAPFLHRNILMRGH